MPVLVDTHCHLDFSVFNETLDDLLDDCESKGVKAFVVPATRQAGFAKILNLGKRYRATFPALGLHPYFVADHSSEDLAVLDALLTDWKESVVAVGEIGLDRFRPDFSDQIEVYEEQLSLAGRHHLPAIIHSVKTHSEVLGGLKRKGQTKGVIHAFSGSFQDASKFIDQGLFIGIGSVITWASARKTRETVAKLPLDALVLETDAPDMAIAGQEKGSGKPQDVLAIFEALCALRDERQDYVADQILRNTLNLFPGVASALAT